MTLTMMIILALHRGLCLLRVGSSGSLKATTLAAVRSLAWDVAALVTSVESTQHLLSPYTLSPPPKPHSSVYLRTLRKAETGPET